MGKSAVKAVTETVSTTIAGIKVAIKPPASEKKAEPEAARSQIT